MSVQILHFLWCHLGELRSFFPWHLTSVDVSLWARYLDSILFFVAWKLAAAWSDPWPWGCFPSSPPPVPTFTLPSLPGSHFHYPRLVKEEDKATHSFFFPPDLVTEEFTEFFFPLITGFLGWMCEWLGGEADEEPISAAPLLSTWKVGRTVSKSHIQAFIYWPVQWNLCFLCYQNANSN